MESLKRAGKSANLVKKTLRLFFKLDLNSNTTFPVGVDISSQISTKANNFKSLNKVFVIWSNDT